MKLIMSNLNKGTKEEFLRDNLLKKYRPGQITILEEESLCKAVIDFPDEENAIRAMEHFSGKKNALEIYNPRSAENKIWVSRMKVGGSGSTSPYDFIKRPKKTKIDPKRRHESLSEQAFDIAFDVTWRAETPLAVNPCSSGGPKSNPADEPGKYQGYDNRWLVVGNRLAISPFTVKSAIANGVASLLGSCYRVMHDKLEGHDDELKDGTYPYGGEYKRYRVARENSNPGILHSINYETGEVEIEPVVEFYYDAPNPPSGFTFLQGKKYYVRYISPGHRNIIQKPDDISDVPLKDSQGKKTAEVFYVGPYQFGMNLTLGPGQFGKGHYHRFFAPKVKQPIKGKISHINLQTLDKQKVKVHMGIFQKLEDKARDPRPDSQVKGRPWHQDLTVFRVELIDRTDINWVYYQAFEGKVTAIGRNFQFKTAFQHSDSVPEGQKACRDIRKLCPRCSLFGMVDGTSEAKREVAGFKGRFKSSALVNNYSVSEVLLSGQIRYRQNKNFPVDLHGWSTSGHIIGTQFLLPIMGAPKPNKRDKGKYFENGFIRGAKRYRHALITWESLKNLINETDQKETIGHGRNTMSYTHELRSYAQVCREGLEFYGTVGAENCSQAEIAAMLMVLDCRVAEHGFKIGLGKPLGLGSVSSIVNRIWIRRSGTYRWEQFEVSADMDQVKQLPGDLSEVQKSINTFKQIHNPICRLDRVSSHLKYPGPGNEYWNGF